jgi:glycosyltransferase involved in cell wall biosynthesis
MKILFTTEHYYPELNGVSLVVKSIAEGLFKRGHDITVATTKIASRNFESLNGIKIIEFDITGNSVKGIKERKKGEIKRYKDLLINGDYDLICQYAAQTWHTDIAYDLLDYINAKKVLFPCGYSGLALWTKRLFYWNYFRKLPFYLRKYDHIIYHSANYIDKTFGDKHGIKHYSIIPNGIDPNEMQIHTVKFREFYKIETKYMLLNVSNHFKLKGHSFVLDAFKLLNRDDATLVIIGNKVFGLRGCYKKCAQLASNNQKVLLLESIPREHVISAFHEADIFVFGSKVECFPLVILEAMSTGVPFISTDVGCIKELGGGIVISTSADMAKNINKLLDNIDFRKTLSISGQNECLSNYTWDKIITNYEDLFQKLVME